MEIPVQIHPIPTEKQGQRPAFIATLVTEGALFGFCVFAIFGQLLALNGVSESTAMKAMILWLVGHLFLQIVAGCLVYKIVQVTVRKYHWSGFLSASIAVLTMAPLASCASFMVILIAFLIMGIK